MVKARITVSIDKQLLKDLAEFQKKNCGVKRATVIEQAIREFLEARK